MKYSDFILKHFVVYALIGGLLPFLIVKNEVFNIDDLRGYLQENKLNLKYKKCNIGMIENLNIHQL